MLKKINQKFRLRNDITLAMVLSLIVAMLTACGGGVASASIPEPAPITAPTPVPIVDENSSQSMSDRIDEPSPPTRLVINTDNTFPYETALECWIVENIIPYTLFSSDDFWGWSDDGNGRGYYSSDNRWRGTGIQSLNSALLDRGTTTGQLQVFQGYITINVLAPGEYTVERTLLMTVVSDNQQAISEFNDWWQNDEIITNMYWKDAYLEYMKRIVDVPDIKLYLYLYHDGVAQSASFENGHHVLCEDISTTFLYTIGSASFITDTSHDPSVPDMIFGVPYEDGSSMQDGFSYVVTSFGLGDKTVYE